MINVAQCCVCALIVFACKHVASFTRQRVGSRPLAWLRITLARLEWRRVGLMMHNDNDDSGSYNDDNNCDSKPAIQMRVELDSDLGELALNKRAQARLSRVATDDERRQRNTGGQETQ